VVGGRSPLICTPQMPDANAPADHVTVPDDQHLHRQTESREGEGGDRDPGALLPPLGDGLGGCRPPSTPARHPGATSARLHAMAFGQHSGPPASAKQMKELLALLMDVGHTDFRDARGPMGFTQRQAAGKFTRDEADAFIARLQGNELDASALTAAPAARLSAQEQLMRNLPADQLAIELRRRGWTVTEP
jgi:hypothetical protein